MSKSESKNRSTEGFLEEGKIEARKYQVDISDKCIGKNSLVVLPTGLGKTIIAVMVAAKTLKLFPNGSKIIMMAPTRPLINQHYESFLKFLTLPEEKFAILTGRTPPNKREDLFRQAQVIFFTPQTLRNDLVHERYSLEDACLVIFDEAHHASGDYPYTMIAEKFEEQNADGTILALTASPGSAKEDIARLCKELRIPPDNIHLRTRSDSDVKTYLKPMDVYKVGVELSGMMDEMHEAIKELIKERLVYLNQMGFLEMKGKDPLNEVYRKDLVALNRQLINIINGDGDKTGAYSAISVNAQALILFHMLELIIQQGLDVLLIYLEKVNRDAQKKSSSKAVKVLSSDRRLKHLYFTLKQATQDDPKSLVHPKHHVLENTLIQEINAKKDARILVFVKLRDSVRNIVSKLKELKSVNAVRFVGQATKSKQDKGLSQKKQLEILDKFKQGKYNVLVSTNVGEEGLDIAECDMVVFYDVVASEIRLIQRKGRTARHREGKVVILYTKDTHDEIYLNIALRRLKKMNFNLRNTGDLKYHYQKLQDDDRENDLALEDMEHMEGEPAYRQEKQSRLPKTQSNLESFINAKKSETMLKKLDAPTIPTIPSMKLGSNIPMKFGLRKKLTQDGISFAIEGHSSEILLFDEVLVELHELQGFDKMIGDALVSQDQARKKRFSLILHAFDFIDFEESFSGHKTLLKRSIREYAEEHKIQLIPIDNAEELYFILKNIHESKNGGS